MADEGAVQSAFNAIVQTVGQTIQTLQDVVAQNAQGVAAAQSSVSTMAEASAGVAGRPTGGPASAEQDNCIRSTGTLHRFELMTERRMSALPAAM